MPGWEHRSAFRAEHLDAIVLLVLCRDRGPGQESTGQAHSQGLSRAG